MKRFWTIYDPFPVFSSQVNGNGFQNPEIEQKWAYKRGGGGGGGANTKVPDMYGVGVFSGPKTQK